MDHCRLNRAGDDPAIGVKARRIVSRIVTDLYMLTFVCLVMAAGVWGDRGIADVATYAFLILPAVGILLSAIEWRWHSARRNEA
jgi:hypothetical protein